MRETSGLGQVRSSVSISFYITFSFFIFIFVLKSHDLWFVYFSLGIISLTRYNGVLKKLPQSHIFVEELSIFLCRIKRIHDYDVHRAMFQVVAQ